MESNDGDPAADRGSPPPPGVGTILNLMQPQQPYEVEDDHSGSGVIRDYNGVFEGPEKTLGKRELASHLGAIFFVISPPIEGGGRWNTVAVS
jgi:hypothetical protein